MSTGLPVFDTTVQETNGWLRAIEQRLPPCGRHEAYAAFRAVTHALRNRLPLEGVISLSSQLPMLLRGLFLEGWNPASGGTRFRTPEAFAAAVALELPDDFPRQPNETAQAVLAVMEERLSKGEVARLLELLPQALRRVATEEIRDERQSGGWRL